MTRSETSEESLMRLIKVFMLQLQNGCKKHCDTYDYSHDCVGCNIQSVIEQLPHYKLVKEDIKLKRLKELQQKLEPLYSEFKEYELLKEEVCKE